MQIPHDRLAPETLTALIKEFVNRDGTDYGEREASEQSKVQQVRAQLDRGTVVVVFDSESETCDLLDCRTFEERRAAL